MQTKLLHTGTVSEIVIVRLLPKVRRFVHLLAFFLMSFPHPWHSLIENLITNLSIFHFSCSVLVDGWWLFSHWGMVRMFVCIVRNSYFYDFEKPRAFCIPNSVFQDARTWPLKHIKPAQTGSLRKAFLE